MNSEKAYKILFTAQEQAELVEIEHDTRPPAHREVVGKTSISLISAGTESAVYQNQRRNVNFPRGSGYASVFEVEAVGSEVKDIKIGDHVFAMGSHQSFQRFSREAVIPLPKALLPETAVFARMMSVSMTTLTTTTARPPAIVLLTGLGLVGNLAAQIFNRCGYEVIACEPLESRRNFALRSGIKNVFPKVPLDDPYIAGKVVLAIDCSGHEQAVLDACKIVQKRGEVVLIATPWVRKTDLLAHDLLDVIFHRYVVVRSGWEWEQPRYPTDFRQNSIYGNFKAALKWLAEGYIKVDGFYTTISPSQAQQAYQMILHKECEGLTMLFDWS